MFLKPAYDNFSLSYNSKTTLNLENNNWFFNPGAFVILTKYILWKGTRPCPFAVTDTGCWANKSVSFILAYWDCSPYMILHPIFMHCLKVVSGKIDVSSAPVDSHVRRWDFLLSATRYVVVLFESIIFYKKLISKKLLLLQWMYLPLRSRLRVMRHVEGGLCIRPFRICLTDD